MGPSGLLNPCARLLVGLVDKKSVFLLLAHTVWGLHRRISFVGVGGGGPGAWFEVGLWWAFGGLGGLLVGF